MSCVVNVCVKRDFPCMFGIPHHTQSHFGHTSVKASYLHLPYLVEQSATNVTRRVLLSEDLEMFESPWW